MLLNGMEGSSLGVWVAHGEGRAHFPQGTVLEQNEIVKKSKPNFGKALRKTRHPWRKELAETSRAFLLHGKEICRIYPTLCKKFVPGIRIRDNRKVESAYQ